MLIDSPAEQGGLKEGDVILKFNGRDIDLSSDLPHIVGRTKAESTVDAEIIRGGEPETLKRPGLLPTREERISRASGLGTDNRLVS